jgi:hypothetical protein
MQYFNRYFYFLRLEITQQSETTENLEGKTL